MEEALRHLRRKDPILKALIAKVGPCAITYHPPTFHALTRAIFYQQLSGKAASLIFRRFLDCCGVRLLKPESILALDDERMRAAGLSGQKVTYVRDLARRTAAGELRFGRHKRLSDEEVIAELTQVTGIGVWTVQMFLMFALRRPDVFPVLDLGVRTAMRRLYGIDSAAKHEVYEAVAEGWRPHRSVASWYMWRSLELK